MEPTTSWFLVRFVSAAPRQEPLFPSLFNDFYQKALLKSSREASGGGWGSQASCVSETGTFALVVMLPTNNLQGSGLAFYPDKAAVYSPKAHNSSYKCQGTSDLEKWYKAKYTEKSDPKEYQGRHSHFITVIQAKKQNKTKQNRCFHLDKFNNAIMGEEITRWSINQPCSLHY